jgi:hypothetical protein
MKEVGEIRVEGERMQHFPGSPTFIYSFRIDIDDCNNIILII